MAWWIYDGTEAPSTPQQLAICNVALLQLGDEVLSVLDDSSRAGRVMIALWTATVQDVLRDHNWNFATARASLVEGTPPAFGYDHAFTLPEDCLRVIMMGEPEDEYEWRIEGRSLLTNEAEANITYIRKVDIDTGVGEFQDETGLYDPKFVTALATLLAARAADALTGVGSGRRKELLADYENLLQTAETIDSQEETPPTHIPNRWIDARR